MMLVSFRYVFNLRGNCRTSGELRKKEAGNVFGLGSRTPIAITLLVRSGGSRSCATDNGGHAGACPSRRKARIFYRDIGDYLSREKKLEIVKNMRSMLDPKMGLVEIHPNAKHDWINQRDGIFDSLISIGDKKDKTNHTVFKPLYSNGLLTARDAWCYNFSKVELIDNMKRSIDFYNANLGATQVIDETKISWAGKTLECAKKEIAADFVRGSVLLSTYRPFCKQFLYMDDVFTHRPALMPKIFPTKNYNRVICTAGVGANSFSCLMTDVIPDAHLLESLAQCFPLYVYTKEEGEQMSLFDKGDDGYRKESGITDFMLERCRTEFGDKITKEDVFYYIYAVLHSPDYRKRFEADLKKSLARIPLCKTGADFAAFVKAGRKLGDLHCGYESVKPWSACVVDMAASIVALPLEKSPSSPMSPSSPTTSPKCASRKSPTPPTRTTMASSTDGRSKTAAASSTTTTSPYAAFRSPPTTTRSTARARSSGCWTDTRSRPTRNLASSTIPTSGWPNPTILVTLSILSSRSSPSRWSPEAGALKESLPCALRHMLQ